MSRMKFFAPLLFLAATLLSNGISARNIASEEPEGLKVIVLDPGHGGKFPGAHYAGVKEKDLTLAVALRLGKLIEEGLPGVKVVYTRTEDKHLDEELKQDLQKRAKKANDSNGNLFLSIHVNASTTPKAKGVETLIMGETPKEQQYNEQALLESNREELISLADDEEGTVAMKRAYIQNMQFTYGQYSMAFARCIQDSYRKAGRTVRKIKPQLLRVLYATNMPCALTEIGFMTNPDEMAYMKSEKGKNEIARSLFDAVREYDARIRVIRRAEEEIGIASDDYSDAAFRPHPLPETAGRSAAAKERKTVSVDAAGQTASAAASSEKHYAVQLIAGGKVSLNASEFKVYRGKVKRYAGAKKGLWKYCVGEYATRREAEKKLREVQNHFPKAFVVCCRGSEVVDEKNKTK